MRLDRLIVIIFLFLLNDHARPDPSDNDIERRAAAAIELCITRCDRMPKCRSLKRADRVMAALSKNKVDLLFMNGEIGIFGPRSPTYEPVLGCGVIDTGRPIIYSLGLA